MSAFRDRIFEASEFIRHELKAKSRHGVHSPLVYELMDRTLRLDKRFLDFERLESWRRQLLQRNESIHVEDYGAGSRVLGQQQRRISQIAKTALQRPAIAQTLFKWVNRFQCARILELGTCLGVTTAYLALANRKSCVYTIEGSEALLHYAREGWRQLAIDHIQSFQGSFQDELPKVLSMQSVFDFIYIDGDHRYDRVMALWHQLKQHLDTQGWLVLDDIHWSPGMRAAWDEICADPMVTLSMDFFDIGIVSVDPTRRKEHFNLKLI